MHNAPGRFLRTTRQALGLTLGDVAGRIGVSLNVYRALEVERGRIPRPEVAAKLAAVLGVAPAVLAHRLGYLPAQDLETIQAAGGDCAAA